MKILIIGGIAKSLLTFRGPLIQSICTKGHEVLACSGEPRSDVAEQLQDWGVNYIPVCLSRAGIRPWEDLRTCWELFCLMKRFQPDVVLTYTIKPVIWGGLAALAAGVGNIYAMVTGLGYAFFSHKHFRGKLIGLLAKFLYLVSLRKCHRVFFQNPDDMQEFLNQKIVQKKQCLLVNGSGVDLDHYDLRPLPKAPHFLMICRLLVAKGVREYIKAARIIKQRYPAARFRLAGPLDSNPAAVGKEELEQWKNEDIVEYVGELEDVRQALDDCCIYVLPSYYREGTPRTVLEAMAMGRPVITTNAPGCRETVSLPDGDVLDKSSIDVIQGENGFLVPVKNAKKLMLAMQQFIDHPKLIKKMGKRSREFAEEKYDVHKVNKVIITAMGLT